MVNQLINVESKIAAVRGVRAAAFFLCFWVLIIKIMPENIVRQRPKLDIFFGI